MATRGLADRIRYHEAALVELRQQQREALVAAIVIVIGPGVAFSARELWQHRLISPALTAAFRDLDIHSPRQLGKRLRQLGLERVGVDQAGAVWSVG